MFYIEKNDKPNWIQKKFNLLKLDNDRVLLPDIENIGERKIEKIANKTNKIIRKNSNSKKIVLSKEIYEQEIFINYLNTYGLEIQNGRWLFELLMPNIVEYIIKNKNIDVDKITISILINDLTELEFENINLLSRKYKKINIVTNHIEKFKKLQENLNKDGIIITITNNKKKSLIKSQIILNIDFTKELINKYNIKDDAIIVNFKGKTKITNKRFNGLNINNYEIDYRDDKKCDKEFSNKYYLKDLYESNLYRKQIINELKNQIKVDGVKIKKLILNNGEI